MKIWIDADACPGAVKEIVIRAARKRNVETIFVANKEILIPQSSLFRFVQVDTAPDAADRHIENEAQPGDLVITQDIPLAHALVHKQVAVINPRGDVFTEENIGERLSIRNFLEERRDSGEITGGPKPFGETEKRNFASTFDRILTRLLR
jgi:uncharacterized protein YaiI (UPF0178 family)